MTTNPQIDGAWTLQSTNTALQGRLHDLGLFVSGSSGSGIVGRSGIIPQDSDASGGFYDLQVIPSSPTPNMSLTVHAGNCVINRSGQGPYHVFNKQDVVVTLDPANVTNPRIDLIIARVYDTAIGDSKTGAWIEAITGTPAGSPVVPDVTTIPGAIALAQIAVAANASAINTGQITDRRQSTGVLGGLRNMLVGDAASTTVPTGFTNGELRLQQTTSGARGEIAMWLNGAWEPVWESAGRDFASFARVGGYGTFADNTDKVLDMDTTVEASDLVVATNNGFINLALFTVQRKGIWMVDYAVRFDSNNNASNGYHRIELQSGTGTTLSSQKDFAPTGTGGFAEISLSWMGRCVPGDAFVPHLTKANGGVTGLNTGLYTHIKFFWMGP